MNGRTRGTCGGYDRLPVRLPDNRSCFPDGDVAPFRPGGVRRAAPARIVSMNPLDDLLRVFWSRPGYQRVFLAFSVGLMLSCAARVAQAQPAEARPAAAIGSR